MTDRSEPYKENIPGRYYVTKVCIGCTLCAEIAPANFKENLDEDIPYDHCFIYKQPETEEEMLLCREAMELCPARAIHDNTLARRDEKI